MSRKKKTPRQSKIRQRDVWRDSMGRFSTKDNRVSEERWYYRVDKKGRIQDLKIDALPFGEFETMWYRSIQVPRSGKSMGKLSVALEDTIKQMPVSRTHLKIDVSMTAKTYHGKIIKRKLSTGHYNSEKIHKHMIGEILDEMFYSHGDRPAYPIKIVNWKTKNRRTTEKETARRRQLYDVTFTIRAEVESRKEAKKRKARKKK